MRTCVAACSSIATDDDGDDCGCGVAFGDSSVGGSARGLLAAVRELVDVVGTAGEGVGPDGDGAVVAALGAMSVPPGLRFWRMGDDVTAGVPLGRLEDAVSGSLSSCHGSMRARWSIAMGVSCSFTPVWPRDAGRVLVSTTYGGRV